jgi:hypothetical protein
MTDATRRMDPPTYGSDGEPCARCGALLARDQRYCLACGSRRSGMSAMLSEARDPRLAPAPAPPPVPARSREPAGWRLDAGFLAGGACLLLALLVGVLIGRSGGGEEQRAAAPQVVTVGGAAAAPAAFTLDWPAGKRGFTVRLQTLPKQGTDAAAVAAAKDAAAGKGAPDVGALDSDAYGTLEPGSYVVYSGQYADRKAAKAALAGLKGSFPDAAVVEVAQDAQAAAGAGGGKAKRAQAGAGKASKPSQAEQQAGYRLWPERQERA